jgi:NAD(P) transhydrogenase
MRRKERVSENEARIIEEQIVKNQIRVYRGVGQIAGDHAVNVVHFDGSVSQLRAKIVVIAVGAAPVTPTFCDLDGERVLDSNTILKLKETPRSMIVLGAGIIGCEYASIFQAAGTKVTLIDKRAEILATVDREIVDHLESRLTALGMEIMLGFDQASVEVIDDQAVVTLTDGHRVTADVCLVALGRQGNTVGLGLETVGIKPDARGQIKVGPKYQTEVPWIYAVGDVIGFPALASTSMEQGRIAVCDAFQFKEELSHLEFYPYGIYCIPEISTLGQSEEELVQKGIPFVVGRASYKEVARGQIVGDEFGLLKMLIHKETRKILGVHIIGDNAADLIHIGQAVMQLGGTLDYFIHNVFNYPTLAEAYKTAAFNAYNQLLGRASEE